MLEVTVRFSVGPASFHNGKFLDFLNAGVSIRISPESTREKQRPENTRTSLLVNK